MFSSFALPFNLRQFGFGRGGTDINIEPVEVHDVETKRDKSSRTLKHLISLNHAEHSIIYHNLHFHNHAPHILGSAYILGATPDQLSHIYEAESKELEPWQDAPGEITKDDWREFLGKRNYQRAYIDFFEDQLVTFGYDWKALVEHYLYDGEQPLINAMFCSLAHPVIHLGYAYELSSKTVAIEALALGTCFYDSTHKYVDDPSYTRPSSYRTTSVLEILQRVAADDRFDDLLDHQGSDNFDILLSKREDAILDHWNAWQPGTSAKELRTAFAEVQKAAAALVVATLPPEAKYRAKGTEDGGKEQYYDFFLLHAFTSSHALRILLPLVPSKFHLSLLRSWLFFTLSAYIGQLRPQIRLSLIEDFDVEDRDWRFVNDRALNSSYCTDAHFVKGLRGLRVAEETWGVQDGYWLKAAVRMAGEFDGWGGSSAATTGYQPREVN